MKHGRKIIYSASLVAFVLTSMIACSKGSSGSANTNGNVAISGNSVSSSDTVNGQTISVSVSGISMVSSYGYGGSGEVTAIINVNGSSANLVAQLYPAGTNAYNESTQQSYVGSYTVYSMGQCIDSACQNVGLVVWVLQGSYQSCNQQLKQIGMVENGGNITQASESVGYESGCGMSPVLPNGPALLSTL